jgi:dynein heavy chain
MTQIQREYTLLMKKCYVIRDMEFNKHDPKWIKLRIRNRYTKSEIKYYGLYVQLQYNIWEYRESL